jgi:hypothetical protein
VVQEKTVIEQVLKKELVCRACRKLSRLNNNNNNNNNKTQLNTDQSCG